MYIHHSSDMLYTSQLGATSKLTLTNIDVENLWENQF